MKLLTSIIISTEIFGKLNVGTQQNCNFPNLCNENFRFFKNIFFLVFYSHLLKILHWIVIITEKFEVFDFAGLCWPSLAFVALDEFSKQKLAFADKIKHNWPVSNNQISKSISKGNKAF